jgi:hypothetical protein
MGGTLYFPAALRSMGFDPVRWLVVLRCLALAATVPFLTWIGEFAEWIFQSTQSISSGEVIYGGMGGAYAAPCAKIPKNYHALR